MSRDLLIRQFLAWHNETTHAQQLQAHHVQSAVIHVWPRHTYDCPLRVTFSYAVGSVDEQAERAFEKARESYERALQLYEIQMLRWEENRRAERDELRRRRAADAEDITHGLRGVAHDLGGFGGPRKPAAPTLAEYATYHRRSGELTGCQLKLVLLGGGVSEGLLWRTPGLAGAVVDEEAAFAGLSLQRHEVDGKTLAKAMQACAKEAHELVATRIGVEGHSLVAEIAVNGLEPTLAPKVDWLYAVEVNVVSHEAGKIRKHQVKGVVRPAKDGAPAFVFAGNPMFTVEHAAKRRKVMFAVCAGVVAIGAAVLFVSSQHNDSGASSVANQVAGASNATTPNSPAMAPAIRQGDAQVWAKTIEPAGPVVDARGTLSTEAKAGLESALSNLRRDTGWRVRILIVPDTDKVALEDAARAVANYWQVERGQDLQALILVTTQSRQIRLEVSRQLSPQLTDQVAGEAVSRAFEPAARSDGLGAGLAALVRELKSVRRTPA